MAILNFQKPDKIILQKATDFEAQFEFRPLEPGYGVTVGNALRRVLLSSLEGYAIVGVKIEGADHEFATLKGVTEDVVEIILNLKQVRFKKKVEHEVAQEKITLSPVFRSSVFRSSAAVQVPAPYWATMGVTSAKDVNSGSPSGPVTTPVSLADTGSTAPPGARSSMTWPGCACAWPGCACACQSGPDQ
jgi:hypothetical protein